MTGKRTRRMVLRPSIFSALCVLIMLIGSAIIVLWQFHAEKGNSRADNKVADSGYFVGPPSLSAAAVDAIFARVGSPMVGNGKVVEQVSRQYDIDDAFALGVWWTETNDGAAGVGLADRNPGSVRGSTGYPAAYDGYTIYTSFAQGISDWFTVVSNRYVSRGLTSAYTLCYSYVGTSSASLWAGKVVNLMWRYRGEAPPPTASTPSPASPTALPPTATPKAVITPTASTHAVLTRSVREAVPATVVPPQTIHIAVRLVKPQTASVSTSSSIPSLPIMGFGLLAAVAIALWGLKIGRGTASMPVRANNAAITTAFFAEDFLPVVMTGPLQDTFTAELDTQPLATVPAETRVAVTGGLLSNYRRSGLRRRLILVPDGIDVERPRGVDAQDAATCTEATSLAHRSRN